jgi:hypothetical protein
MCKFCVQDKLDDYEIDELLKKYILKDTCDECKKNYELSKYI